MERKHEPSLDEVQLAASGEFFRARNYHVFQRTDEARRSYHAGVESYPENQFVDDALYELGLLELRQGANPKAAAAAFRTLLERFPDQYGNPPPTAGDGPAGSGQED
ncbi:MAG: tetratricopeptide repeat protein [Chloroflexi bacterium]|nr:tetratricopeptide repeat protein [Chloroflexota bacterium]